MCRLETFTRIARRLMVITVAMLLLFQVALICGCGGTEHANKAFDEIPENPKPGAMYRADPQRTGVYPDSGKVPKGEYLWRIGEDGWKRAKMNGPVYNEGIVYYAGWLSTHICAVDAKSGSEIWSFDTTRGNPDVKDPFLWVTKPPVIAGKAIYFSSFDMLYALEAGTATVVWQFQAGGEIVGTPLVNDGTVFIACIDGNIYALEAKTGHELWRFDYGSSNVSLMSFSNGKLYFNSGSEADGYRLIAIDCVKGEEAWRFEKGSLSGSPPCISGDIIYFGGVDGYIYALDSDTGEERWKLSSHGRIWSCLAVYESYIYYGSDDGCIYAIDKINGDLKWQHKTAGDYIGSPSIADGVVYVESDDQNIYALDAHTGNELWRVNAGMDLHGSPCIMDGVVYFEVGAIK